MMKKEGTKICKYCKSEIPAGAKVCPNCRKKQGIKIWQIVLIVIVLGIFGSVVGGSGSSNKKDASSSDTQKQEVKIEYTQYNVNDLMQELDDNALNAEKKYKDQYVELTGKLSNIDSSGKYIDILRTDEEFSIIGVQCYVTDDSQKDSISQLKKGDMIVVKGKITDVGEVMGYSLDIDEISSAQ